MRTYDEIVESIIANYNKLNYVYDCLDEINQNHSEVLSKNFSELFEQLRSKAPLALYALFGHHATRPYYALDDKDYEYKFDNKQKIGICHLSFDKRVRIRGGIGTIWTIDDPDKALSTDAHESINEISRKLSFINKLREVTDKIFINRKKQDIANIASFMKKRTFNTQILRDEEENWDVAELPFKDYRAYGNKPERHVSVNYMLVYGDRIDLRVAKFNDHSNPIVSTSLSLLLPIFNGFYFCRPGVGDSGSVFYMEAR